MIINNDGEKFIPEAGSPYEVLLNIERYNYAAGFCIDKTVIDAGCGCGLGTYFYSLVAKKVYAVDYKQDALECTKRYPLKDNVTFWKADLNTEFLPEADVCVALEVIEHLENPFFFLAKLKAPILVFSIPHDSLATSTWHKQDFKSFEEIVDFIEHFYKVKESKIQDNKWILGYGEKI